MTKRKSEYVTKNFRGAVILKEWMIDPQTGNNANCYIGKISIIQDTEAVGFTVQKSEANWAALIQGEKSNLWILGCQIRAILADESIKANNINSFEVR
ncbi:MAG: hypothetical protein ACHQUC_01345 [Chlamydiales bacterium]